MDVALGRAGAPNFTSCADRYIHHIDEEEEEMFPAARRGIERGEGRVELRARSSSKRKPAEIERALEGADEGDERE